MPRSGTRRRRARDCWRNSRTIAPRTRCAPPSPTKPRPAGVWSLKDLPEAGKPAAGWGGVRGGGSAILSQVAPPLSRRATPSPPLPHKGGGSRPSLRRGVLVDRCACSPHAGGNELLETHRVALARGLARLNAREAARLDEPLPPRRKLPAALHGLARVPAHRFVLDVHHLVMGIEQLDAVSVRIAQVDEERVAGAMATRPELDIGGKAHFGGEIADIEKVIGFRDRERGVMEPRPCPGGKHDIVGVALALQEHEQEFLASVRRDVFREPEAQAHPEFARALHVGNQELEMIDPLRHRAVVVLERDHEAWLDLHGRAELDRSATCVHDMQGAALVRNLDPFRRQAGSVEKRLGLLQILVAEDAHADALGLRLAARALENEAVMTRLGDAAKIERIAVFIADDEAEEVPLKVSAHPQILH